MEQDNNTLDQPATYAIGDIHGEISLLRLLITMLPYQPDDTLVFLGDYLDRGEDSIATIHYLQQLARKHPNCIFIRGNHDETWLEQWDGKKFKDYPRMPGAAKVWQSCNGQMPTDIGHWLAATRIEYEDEHAYYVHAGVRPDKPFSETSPFEKLWGSHDFLTHDARYGKTVVFGHWQLAQPLLRSRRIGIDTGAWQTGILSAIRLPDRAIFQTQPHSKP